MSSRSAAVTATTSVSAMRPVVTVPVLSRTIVSTRRVDSSTSGPLMSRPSCAPRPVPTSSAVGVASPSAHGQAMIRTATAAVKANSTDSPVPIQKPSVAAASAITTGTKTPETRSARRWTGALPDLRVGDQAGDLGERGVGADACGADDESAAGVDRRPHDVVAGSLLHRDRLAGQQRLVEGRAALLARHRRWRPARRVAPRSGRRPRAAPRGRAVRCRARRAPRRPWPRARAAPRAPSPPAAWRAPRSSGPRAGTPSPPTRPRGRSRACRPPCRGSGRSVMRMPGVAGVAEQQRVQRPR